MRIPHARLSTCGQAFRSIFYRSSHALSWETTRTAQQTLAKEVSRSGTALHSGATTTARLLPAMAGEGRYFVAADGHTIIPASPCHVIDSLLCTTLSCGNAMVRTVEHLLSALEASSVDNCRIEIHGSDEEWMECIEEAGLVDAEDSSGCGLDRMAPVLHEPVHVWRGDSFVIAFPSSETRITYGIDFPEVPAIRCQWFSKFINSDTFLKEIASARTFCILEEVEKMRNAGLIRGGSLENAIVCSASAGWVNPPLRFDDEPCRHKVIDLIGDLSLLARNGNRGLPLAHIIAYKTRTAQQTLAKEVSRSGTALHSGATTTARLLPAMAGEGRYFVAADGHTIIPASPCHVIDSLLCTTLSCGNAMVRTVEHLLSALEASSVDNCRIEIHGSDEVPLLDGSAKEWMECIEEAGLVDAEDSSGCGLDRMAPVLHEPVHVWRGDSFVIAFPSSETRITYGIDFPEVPAIRCQWFSKFINSDTFLKEIASARTFCILEEVEKMRNAGLIRGGSLENAIVCSASAGWVNPPLRFDDEPCRHKVIDLIGDLSLLARNGNRGLPLAHIIAYKAGHSLHCEFARRLSTYELKIV